MSSIPNTVKVVATHLYLEPERLHAWLNASSPAKAAEGLRDVYDTLQAFTEDDIDDGYSWRQDPYDDFDGVLRNFNCCGGIELQNLTHSEFSDMLYAVVVAIQSGYRYLQYFSINENTDQYCADLGFTCVTTFKNHNTGRDIRVWILNLWSDE